jgi:type I restriction enzyme M protein
MYLISLIIFILKITKLSKAKLLYPLIQKFSETKIDLHPNVVSNHEMG